MNGGSVPQQKKILIYIINKQIVKYSKPKNNSLYYKLRRKEKKSM
jgi:hypothetical protein